MNLGEMAWKVYKEEVMRLIMVRIRRSFKKAREKLEKVVDTQDMGEDVESYIEGKIEKLTIYIDSLTDGSEVAEKDLCDFDSAVQTLLRDTLVWEAKGLARRRTDPIGQ